MAPTERQSMTHPGFVRITSGVRGGVNAEKTLGGASRLEPLPLAPSSSHRLMQIFGSVVPING
jgi:hypothetical protein